MTQHTAAAGPSSSLAPILGECLLKLTHSTTYEPPLYLFPELLPQVPQGTPPLPVWDAVADAVDISASYWRMADARELLTAGAAAAGVDGEAGKRAVERTPQAMVTLMSMIANNRLMAAGLDAAALKRNAFSSAAIIQNLSTLHARMGLNDEEGAAIMSNHFINLLAWQKLRELNGGEDEQHVSGSKKEGGIDDAAPSSRKRGRTSPEDANDLLLPSPNPWSTDSEMMGEQGLVGFVSATEPHVEKRVELLSALEELYRRPWRTLVSRAQQTDMVIPPGNGNVTSPYADPSKIPGAMLDPLRDLGWGTTTEALSETLYFGTVRVARNPSFFSVVLSAKDTSSGSPAAMAAPTRLPLDQLTTYFGRESGVLPAAAVSAGAAVPIDGAMAEYSVQAEVLSRFHFALVLRPVYAQQASARGSTPAAVVNGSVASKRESSEDERDANDGRGTDACSSKSSVTMHTKTPHHYSLWLVNYGRNGVRISGHGWVLGEPRELRAGDIINVGDAVQLLVEQHPSAAAARSPEVSHLTHATTPSSTSQVKHERVMDDEDA